MINTHLKFKDKILNGSKVVAFTRNDTKFLMFQGQFDHEDQGQGHQFRTCPRPLCDQYMVQV